MGLECALWKITPSQLDELKLSDEAVDALICGEEGAIDAECLDIDKTWHAIHFLLTGEPEGGKFPLSFAIMEGHTIAEDFIDGATYLFPKEVEAVSEALSALPDELVYNRYDSEEFSMTDIYRGPWDESVRNEVIKDYQELKKFFSGAASERNAILRHIG